jgi:uncharacterized protein YcfL
MNRLLLKLSLFAAAGIFLAGCAAQHDAIGYVPLSTTVNDLENHELVVLLDSKLQYSVTCDDIQQRSTPDGRLELTATIRNHENRPLQLQMDCVFKDDQGYPSDGQESSIQSLVLAENAREPVHFVALNAMARRYTIRIREALTALK